MSDGLNLHKNLINGRISDVVRRNRNINLPMMIFGPPGIGKSEQVHQSRDGENDMMIDLRLNILDSIDLRGLPIIQRNEKGVATHVEWVRPEFIPWDGRGIIFLDEIESYGFAWFGFQLSAVDFIIRFVFHSHFSFDYFKAFLCVVILDFVLFPD